MRPTSPALLLAVLCAGCVLPALPDVPDEDATGPAERRVVRPKLPGAMSPPAGATEPTIVAPVTPVEAGGGLIAAGGGNMVSEGAGLISAGGLNALPALSGMVRVPASLISAGGGNLIAAGGGNIIGQAGGNYRVAALPGTAVTNAGVRLVDAAGAPVPGIDPVKTDAEGRYRFAEAPAGQVLFVRVEVPEGDKTHRFEAMARAAAEPGAQADVSPASTLVVQKTRLIAAEQEAPLTAFDPAKAAEVAKAAEQALSADAALDFSQAPTQLTAAFDRLLQKDAALAERSRGFDKNVAVPLMREKKQLVKAGVIFSPEHVAYDPAGNLFIAGLNDHTVWKVPAGGGAAAALVSNRQDARLKFPHGLACDAEGNVYVGRRIGLHHSEPGSNGKDQPGEQVFKISPDGKTVTPLNYTFRGPGGMVLDPVAQVLYVTQSADWQSQIIAYDLKAGAGRVLLSEPGLVTSVALDSQRRLYMADDKGGVYTVDATGQKTEYVKRNTAGDGGFYEHLAFDAADNLYVTNNWGKTVFKFTPRARKLETRFTFNNPTGIARDPKGNLAIADYGSGEVWLLTP